MWGRVGVPVEAGAPGRIMSGLWTPSHLSPPPSCGRLWARPSRVGITRHPPSPPGGGSQRPQWRRGGWGPGGGVGPMPGVQLRGCRRHSLLPPFMSSHQSSRTRGGSRQPGVHIHKATVLGKLGVWCGGHLLPSGLKRASGETRGQRERGGRLPGRWAWSPPGSSSGEVFSQGSSPWGTEDG